MASCGSARGNNTKQYLQETPTWPPRSRRSCFAELGVNRAPTLPKAVPDLEEAPEEEPAEARKAA